jgi:hypothetical protein
MISVVATGCLMKTAKTFIAGQQERGVRCSPRWPAMRILTNRVRPKMDTPISKENRWLICWIILRRKERFLRGFAPALA